MYTLALQIAFIGSRRVAIIPEYTPFSESLVVLEDDLDVGSNTYDKRDNNDKALLLRIPKCVAVPKNTDEPVSVTDSCDELLYISFPTKLTQRGIPLPTLGTVNAQHYLPT